MSRESALLAGRRAAELALVDTVRFYRRTGRMVQDEDTGREVAQEEFLFESPCKVRIGALGSLVPTAKERVEGGREATMLRSVMHLPVDAPTLLPNDIGILVAIGDVSDPQLLNRRYMVVAPIGQTYATARRFSVEEILA